MMLDVGSEPMDYVTPTEGSHQTIKVTAAALVLFVVFYYTGLGAYRLIFSPLAGFPGPRVAALTGWYEFYHDYWCQGTYIFRIQEMHQAYGMCSLGSVSLSLVYSDCCKDPSYESIPTSCQSTIRLSTILFTLLKVKDVPKIIAISLEESTLMV